MERVTLRGLLAVLGTVGLLGLVACSSGGGDAVAPDVESYTVGSTGRTINYTAADYPDIQVTMEVPPGAVPDGTEFTVQTLPAEPGMVPGMVFEFGPDGIEIPSTVELVLEYDPATLSVPEELLSVFRQVGDAWQEIPSTVYPEQDTIVALLDGFSRYGVGGAITTADPGWGHYLEPIEVTLTCDDGTGIPCAATYYTTDGTAPTTSSPKYTAPIPIETATTLRFFSVDGMGNREPTRLSTYSIETGQEWDRPETTATPSGGNQTTPVSVELVCDDGDGSGCAATYYETDDSSPLTASSRVYTESIPIDATTTLRFYSVDEDGNRERSRRELYLFGADQDVTPPSTTATPPGGTYGARQVVALQCDDGEGVGCDGIFYTTDGSEPTLAGNQYQFPLPVSTATTLKFFAVDRLGNQEPVKTEHYRIVAALTPFSVGGAVTGLDGELTLQLNHGEELIVGSDGSYAFETLLADVAEYRVDLTAWPSGQVCTLYRSQGTIDSSSVDDVDVACVDRDGEFTVGGTVSGLVGTLVLDSDDDQLEITQDGEFTFPITHEWGTSYAVEVASAPPTQTCTVTNPFGMVEGNVTHVAVNCVSDKAYIGATVSGLDDFLLLRLNDEEPMEINDNGEFAFPTLVPRLSTYTVELFYVPALEECTITDGTGPVLSVYTTVTVTCRPNPLAVTIGGTVSGLDGTLVLQNNGTDDLTITESGSFTFASPMAGHDSYAISILSQPASQACSLSDGFGMTFEGVDVTSIQVDCVTDRAVVEGTVSGLDGGLVGLWLNRDEELALRQDGAFAFTSLLELNSAFTLEVYDQSPALACVINVGGGIVLEPGQPEVTITCEPNPLAVTIGGTVSGLDGTLVLQNNGTDDLTITENGSFTFATPMEGHDSHAIQVLSQPENQTCMITNGFGITHAGTDVTDILVACAYNSDLARGQAVLGPVAYGDAEIFDIADLSTPVYVGRTSGGEALDEAGFIQIDSTAFAAAALYLVVVSEGEALDFDGDGVADEEHTRLDGKVHALLTGTQLSAGGWFVSEVTEAAYRAARYLLQADYDVATVVQSLDSSARGLLSADRNGDATLDHLDLALWHPVTHSESTRMPAVTRNIIREELLNGAPVRGLSQTSAGWIAMLDLGDVNGVNVVGDLAYVVLDGPCTLKVVDIGDPRSPTVVGQTNIYGGCESLNAVEVVGNTLYTVGDGFHVVDVSDPTDPAVIGNHYQLEGFSEDLNSQPLRIRGNTAFISPYGSWDEGRGGTLVAIDISDPAAPVIQGTFFPSVSYSWPLDVQLAGDTAYLLLGGSSGVNSIVDISDPSAMVEIGTLTLDYRWDITTAAVAGDYLYTAQGMKLVVSDISTPSNPQIVSEISPPRTTAFYGQWFTGDLAVSGDRAYVGGYERIYVLDLSFPAAPQIMGHVPVLGATGDPKGFAVSGGLAYVGNYNGGLHIVDITDPAYRGVLGSVAMTDHTGAVEAQGNLAYVVDAAGLEVVDLDDPTAPQISGNVPAEELLTGDPFLALTGETVFYGAGNINGGGLNVVEVSDPEAPTLVAQYPEYPQVSGMALGDYLYLAYRPLAVYPATSMPAIQALGYADPSDLSAAGGFPTAQVLRGLAEGPGGVDTKTLYYYNQRCGSPPDYSSLLIGQEVDSNGDLVVASGELPTFTFNRACVGDVAISEDVALATTRGEFGDYLYALDISDPSTISYLDQTPAYSGNPKQVTVVGRTAYVAASNAGLLIVDVEPNGTLTPSALVKTPGVAVDVAVTGDYAVVADGDALRVVRLPVRAVP